MVGMLIGLASLSAWGLYKFNQYLAEMPKPKGTNLLEIGAQLAANVRAAYTMQYSQIFFITTVVCVVGAVLGLLITGKHEQAKDVDSATEPVAARG
jgi:hypothetical protein